MNRRGEGLAVAALAFLLGVTAVWWAVALWPAGEDAPAWLQTARAVCFGAHADGLPNAGGWILLIGEPLGMVAALYLLWRDPLTAGLRTLGRRRAGRALLGGVGMALALGLGAAGWRVVDASTVDAAAVETPLAVEGRGGPAPALRLVDQHGDTLSLERLRGRPVFVTFAYAHCETVCPLLVHDALRAQGRLADRDPALVVVTLDPWRDVPSRLPYIAEAWRLGSDSFVLSGDVETVQRVLRDWEVSSARDPSTGEVVHPPVTYVVDGAGGLAFSTGGRVEELVRAVDRLR